MPAFNFKKQFAYMVEFGLMQYDHPWAKRQTIRAPRKDGRDPKPGDRLYLYTGMRTKSCIKIGEAMCKSKEPIAIEGRHNIVIGTAPVPLADENEFARKDGFDSADEFFEFFQKTHGFPFNGFLYKW